MSWIRFSHGFRLNPIAEGSPEALVVMLHDFGASAPVLTSMVARWAAAVPTTSFILLDGVEQLGLLSRGLAPHMNSYRDSGTEPTRLNRAARRLEAVFDEQLCSHGFDTGRVVLVGVGLGGTVALHMVLNHGWGCAGVLAFVAKPTGPLPRLLRIDSKVRLIKCLGDGHLDHTSLHDVVASLSARGVDTRGVLLGGSTQSDEAMRHGGAYLVELVANAQRGGRVDVAGCRS
jgi:phospholipase/carboxylesterase